MSQQVSEYNVMSWIHEWMTGSEFLLDTSEAVNIDSVNSQSKSSWAKSSFKISFLSCNPDQFINKKKFDNFFDIIYVGTSLAQRIIDLNTLLKHQNGVMISELVK